MKDHRCLVCDTKGKDNWENVDQYRIKPSGMVICKNCGFVTYERVLGQDNKSLKSYYETDYRKPPTINNLYTGQRKLNYHAAFLNDLLDDWDKEQENPMERGKGKEIFEVGAAYGIVLNWIKKQFPKANVKGTEWTKSFKRNAWHEYGVELVDEFEDDKKYDLIMSYKVAEHQIDADEELRKYALSLKENGKVYVSVPQWFGELNNFGMSGFDIEYYFHPDHINAWTREHFEHVLRKAGLKVIKKDHTLYDSTYLCVRDDAVMINNNFSMDYKDIIKKLEAIKKADEMLGKNDFVGAIEVYPNFPIAHTNRYELNRKKFHDMGLEKMEKEVIEVGIRCCPECPDMYGMAADIYMRYDKWDQALKMLDTALGMRPGVEKFMISAATCLMKMATNEKDVKERNRLLLEAKNVLLTCKSTSLQALPQCTDMIYKINSTLPTPNEATTLS
ncbi:MAG: methyltransferase domain-containing protein [Bacteriovoracaceae bacterium]